MKNESQRDSTPEGSIWIDPIDLTGRDVSYNNILDVRYLQSANFIFFSRADYPQASTAATANLRNP